MNNTSNNNITSKNIFSTVITDFYVKTVCTQVSEWLKENKSVDVTCEELCGIFDIDIKNRQTSSSNQISSQTAVIPGYFTGTGSSTPKRRGGRRPKVKDPNAVICCYIYTRGKRDGKQCTDPVLDNGSPGSDKYCKTCIKKAGVQKCIAEGGSGSSSNKVAPPVLPGNKVVIPEETKKSTPLNVVPVPGTDDMFKTVGEGFIVQSHKDGTIVAIAKEDDDNGVHRPLTTEEKVYIQQTYEGMSVLASPESSPENINPQSIEVPQIPQVSDIPQIPNVPNLSSGVIV